jgi:hypothetical protein
MDAKQYGNRPAFPHAAMTEQVTVPTQHPGLTVRELFAGLALQGMVQRDNYSAQDAAAGYPNQDAKLQARAAVRFADALVAELAKDGA